MKIALLQFDISWEDRIKNFNKVRSHAEEAKKEGADLLILPELFSTGYTMNSGSLAEDLSGETPSFLSGLAKDNKIHVLGSFIEKTDARPKNSAVIFDRNGKLLLHYSKIHLWSFANEDKSYQAGNDISVCELENHKVAVAICYDLRFPELFRRLIDTGVECVFVIASWPKPRIEHWDLLLKTRAIENQLFVVGVNRVGKSPLGDHPGHSKAVDPFGNIIASAKENKEEIVIAEIDFDSVSKSREQLPFLKDRVYTRAN
jgi:omega-amidase